MSVPVVYELRCDRLEGSHLFLSHLMPFLLLLMKLYDVINDSTPLYIKIDVVIGDSLNRVFSTLKHYQSI